MSFNDSKANMTEGEQNPDHPGGKKVEDPNAQEIRENAGPIASDSLAAESSAFQSSNRNAEPLGVKGSNSTFANKNTSGAVTLEPTASRKEDFEAYPDATAKMGHSAHNTKSDGTNRAVVRDVNLANYHHTEAGSLDDNGNPAPSYVDPVAQGAGLSDGYGKVKGKNLKEVGKGERFEDEGKQPKGGASAREDEDREAVRKMQQGNAIRDTSGSGVNAKSKGQQGSVYDALNSEENA